MDMVQSQGKRDRKVATLLTEEMVLDLKQGEVKWLSNHLSYTVKTHSDFYRFQEAVIEIGKVTKLLMLTENGNVAKFQRQSLQTLQIDDDVTFDMEDDEADCLVNQDDPIDEDITQDSAAFDDENDDEGSYSSQDDVMAQASDRHGKKRKFNEQPSRLHFGQEQGSRKSRRKLPKTQNEPYLDEELDDSDRDPDYLTVPTSDETDSEPDTEPHIASNTVKRKKRWSLEEKRIFKCFFRKYINNNKFRGGR